MIRSLRQHPIFCAVALALSLAALSPAHADSGFEVQDVVSPGGVNAWLVEDHSLPMIAIRFRIEGGALRDPEGKEGLTYLMSGLLNEGAGDLPPQPFQAALETAGIVLKFHAYQDSLVGSVRMLTAQQDLAFDLLAMAVTEPRFDEDKISLIKRQILGGINAEANDPDAQGSARMRAALYPDHPYQRSIKGTQQSVSSLTRTDLLSLHAESFHSANINVAVVGAITSEDLAHRLDEIFGALPTGTPWAMKTEAETIFGGDAIYETNSPSTQIRLAFESVPRTSEDYAAFEVVNHILAAETGSRLFNELREKLGLVYGVKSQLHTRGLSQEMIVFTYSQSDKVDEVVSRIQAVMQDLAEKGPKEAELAAAKRFVAGSFAVKNFKGSLAGADTLVDIKADGLSIDYLSERAASVGSVTAADVQRVAQHLVSQAPTRLFIGTPAARTGN